MTTADFNYIFVLGTVRFEQLESRDRNIKLARGSLRCWLNNQFDHATYIITMVRVNDFIMLGHSKQGGDEGLQQEAVKSVLICD